MLPQVLFLYFAFAIVALSLAVITRKNPVHSVIFMLVLFFHIAALYLTLNAEFLAAIQIIVYAGAILVLFLFVVLMLNLKEEVTEHRYISLWAVGVLLSIAISAIFLMTLSSIPLGAKGVFSPDVIASETHTVALGKLLYTEFLYPFEIASVILLVAIVGAVVLAKKRLKS
ncbi:MAG: NADH-quinone oxidoreductase subunit J [Thermodesulfovibrionales bacterium]|nr:NADH-quinone oxidoreductase subunit J [Thermodesulfovibrionales bacterium]